MNRWKLTPLAGLMFSASLAAGCTVYETSPQSPDNVTYVERDPPPERAEPQPPPPTPEHVWMRGHWRWDGHDWDWVPGQYVSHRPGYRWEPGRWERRTRGWIWVEGRWGR